MAPTQPMTVHTGCGFVTLHTYEECLSPAKVNRWAACWHPVAAHPAGECPGREGVA